MKSRIKYLIITLGLLSMTALAQENYLQLSGNLNEDFIIASLNTELNTSDTVNISFKKRSPLLAGGLSFILPGAGQFYNEDYWKTAIFAAIEIAAISTAIIYNNKGDDQTQIYKNIANASDGWDVDQYAQWSVDNAQRINPGIEENDPVLDIFDDNGVVIWSKLNNLETAIGSWYSHRLAPYDDQQFYEMIGKYQQFNPGWSDYSDADYPPDGYTYNSSRKDVVTPNFLSYADERGKANDYYNVTNTAIAIIIANHVLSAVEAALAANSYNRSFKANVSIESTNIGYQREYYPKLHMSYNF